MTAMADPKEELTRIRQALDDADAALTEALDARAHAARELARLREQSPETYIELPRDHEVIAQAVERVKEFPRDAVQPVLREVLSGCAALTSPIEVVYVGQEGGFGHLAARSQFGASASLRAVGDVEDVLSEVERDQASFGLVPFETSNDGAVTSSINLLARGDAKICAEIPIRRTFDLISRAGDRQSVAKIYASSSAIAACEKHLQARYPGATIIDTRNGIVAAERAAAEPEAAALVTSLVAEQSELTPIERGIEDVADLHTRYVAVGKDYPPRTGKDRTAVVVALHDAPGVLVDCLQPFADRKINLFRLETRPARGWEFPYLILFEVDGHITDRHVLTAIEELRGSSRYVKVLGSYPRVTEV
ncbi:MAG: prephenate dehydratase domain-containing protein [Myxococcales bacterium]|jgi:chorismate mutase/prephenate dehydratase